MKIDVDILKKILLCASGYGKIFFTALEQSKTKDLGKRGHWHRVFQVRPEAIVTPARVFLLSRFSAALLFILNEGHQTLSNSSQQT